MYWERFFYVFDHETSTGRELNNSRNFCAYEKQEQVKFITHTTQELGQGNLLRDKNPGIAHTNTRYKSIKTQNAKEQHTHKISNCTIKY